MTQYKENRKNSKKIFIYLFLLKVEECLTAAMFIKFTYFAGHMSYCCYLSVQLIVNYLVDFSDLYNFYYFHNLN